MNMGCFCDDGLTYKCERCSGADRAIMTEYEIWQPDAGETAEDATVVETQWGDEEHGEVVRALVERKYSDWDCPEEMDNFHVRVKTPGNDAPIYVVNVDVRMEPTFYPSIPKLVK